MKSSLPLHITNPRPSIYNSDNYVVFDFETTNLDKGSAQNQSNRIVCVTWKCGPSHPSVYVDPFNRPTNILYDINPLDPGSFKQFKEDILAADFIIAHNAKFECGWMDRLGFEFWDLIWMDTMLMEYVIQGNRRSPVNLDTLVDKYFGENKQKLIKVLMEGGVCPSEMPHSLLNKYAKLDTELTEKLWLAQREHTNLYPCIYTKCLFVPVLYDIESKGMVLDKDRVLTVYNKVNKEYTDTVRRMDELTGGINFRSSKQVCEYLYDVLGFDYIKEKGEDVRSASKNIIMKLVAKTPDQQEFLNLKLRLSVLEAELSKALSKFKECVEETDGTLYAEFSQIVTQTHRLASKGKGYNVQFQNMPRKFKPLFKARHEGWEIVEVDEAQLEFRAAVQLANDKQGYEDVITGWDVHKNTASILEDVSIEEVTKDQRQNAKPDTFKPLYGGSRGTPAQEKYYAEFRKRYPEIAATQERWADEVLNTKKLVLDTGLIFYWPDTVMYNSGYIKNTTNIYNYPVQYIATAEVVPVAVICQWHRMKSLNMKSFLINTIHDSTIGEVPPEEREQYDEIAHIAFVDDVYDYMKKVYDIDWFVPLDAETGGSSHWNDREDWRNEWLNAA